MTILTLDPIHNKLFYFLNGIERRTLMTWHIGIILQHGGGPCAYGAKHDLSLTKTYPLIPKP